jgi:hypothetical protein
MKVRDVFSGRVFKAEWQSEEQAALILETGEIVDPTFFEVMEEPEKSLKEET